MTSLILFNKPYRVLSQFTDSEGRENLGTYINQPDFYPAGRLDYDSEGLLLLTDSGTLQHQISHPNNKLEKTYWVQVEGTPTADAIDQLRKGIVLKDGLTKPAKVVAINEPDIWPRHPPIRFRQSIPTHWLQITIAEGRNRQVRRMTAAIGLPTLRLVRSAIGDWTLGQLLPGDFLHMPINVDHEPSEPTGKKPHKHKENSYKQPYKKRVKRKYK